MTKWSISIGILSVIGTQSNNLSLLVGGKKNTFRGHKLVNWTLPQRITLQPCLSYQLRQSTEPIPKLLVNIFTFRNMQTQQKNTRIPFS